MIASLVFVAVEIRQNTEAVRSSTIQAIIDSSVAASALIIQHPDLRRARQAVCSGTLTDDQRQQLDAFYGVMLRVQLNRYYQIQLGIVDEGEALDLGGRGGVYRSPFFREYWPTRKERYTPEFQEFVERELLPLSASECTEVAL